MFHWRAKTFLCHLQKKHKVTKITTHTCGLFSVIIKIYVCKTTRNLKKWLQHAGVDQTEPVS